MKIILYSTPTCGICKVVKENLIRRSVDFEICQDQKIMSDKGITTVPTLEVDGKLLTGKKIWEQIRSLGEGLNE